MKQYLKDKNFRAGLLITGIMLCVILIGLLWTPYDPNAMSGSEKLLKPSAAHLFGTDNFGRDIFSRVIQGADRPGRISFFIPLDIVMDQTADLDHVSCSPLRVMTCGSSAMCR